jgi:methylated-DNA-[protein]-cysteine S-methyltransferase
MNAKPPEKFQLDRFATPIGTALLVTGPEGALRALDWEDYESRMRQLLRLQYGTVVLQDGPAPQPIRDALADYFSGDVDRLRSIPLRIAGTPFQRKVWTALQTIPAGSTLSYGVLAKKLEVPTAVRAVGHANGSNPISVVIPCHRVIGAAGALTGYGGGIDRKRWLLRHEGAVLKRSANARSIAA